MELFSFLLFIFFISAVPFVDTTRVPLHDLPFKLISFSPFPLPLSQLSVDWLPISGISAPTDIIKCQVQRPIDQKKTPPKKTRNQEFRAVWSLSFCHAEIICSDIDRSILLWYKHLQHRSTAKLDILSIHSVFSRSWSKLLHLTHDWWKLCLTWKCSKLYQ